MCIQVDHFDCLNAYLFKDEDMINIDNEKQNQLFILLNKFHSAHVNQCVMNLCTDICNQQDSKPQKKSH